MEDVKIDARSQSAMLVTATTLLERGDMQLLRKAISFGLTSGIMFALLMTGVIAFDSSSASASLSPKDAARFILEVFAVFSVLSTLVGFLVHASRFCEYQ